MDCIINIHFTYVDSNNILIINNFAKYSNKRGVMMGRLDGKIAIITGASSGMGAEQAVLFIKEGAKVVATDIQYDRLLSFIDESDMDRTRILPLEHDVRQLESWQNIVKETKKHFGKIDILVNNAGITGTLRGIHEIPEEEWDRVNDVNAKGIYLGMKSVIPKMLEDGGSIINISSIASFVGSSSSTVYTASKGAVSSLTKSVALSYAENKIRVNSIHPGYIATPMTAEQLSDPKRAKFMYDSTPLPYLGEPIDIAYGALYLASDEAKYVTGSALVIDGGYIAR